MVKKNSQKIFLLIVFCLLFSLSFSALFEFIKSKKSSYEKTREKFSAEISKSLLSLSFDMSELVRDLEKEGGIDFFDSNSAKRFFSSYLSLAELDEIQIFSKDCKLIWGFSLLQRKSSECFAASHNDFFVTDYKNTPLVFVTKKISSKGKNYFIQGSFHLGSTWLRKHPLLEKNLTREDLVLSSQLFSKSLSGGEVFFSFFPHSSEKNSFNINLLVDSYLYTFLGFFSKGKDSLSFLGRMGLLLLSLFLLLLLFFEDKKRKRRERSSYLEFKKWCHDALVLNEKELYSLCLGEIRKEKSENFSEIYRSSSEVIGKKLQDNFNLQTKIKKLEKIAENYQRKNLALSQRGTSFSEYSSLCDQISWVSPVISSQLAKGDEMTKKVAGIIRNSLLKKIEIMSYQFLQWEQGGESVGFKKYIRSLHETKGNSEEASLLEEQVNFFVSATSNVKKELVFCSELLRSIPDQTKGAFLPLGHWESLASGSQKKQDRKISILLEKAAGLCKLYSKRTQFKFEKLGKGALLPNFMNEASFVSAFCHIFNFFSYPEGSAYMNQITVKFTSEEEKDFLLVSSDLKPAGEGQKGSEKKLQLSEDLLRPMGALQRRLQVEGTSFVSLEWYRSEPFRELAAQSSAEYELGG